ncbi:TetR family transcriptional regulator [Corynebacterium suedekumii]|nr:TetR family transcriptional regulator [Corynebacterium suedekumii]
MRSSAPDILVAVWQVIATRGIDAVSFRSVAAAADVSVGRVQHHFPTRTGLIRAAARHMIDSASEALPRNRRPDPAHPPFLRCRGAAVRNRGLLCVRRGVGDRPRDPPDPP